MINIYYPNLPAWLSKTDIAIYRYHIAEMHGKGKIRAAWIMDANGGGGHTMPLLRDNFSFRFFMGAYLICLYLRITQRRKHRGDYRVFKRRHYHNL